LALQPLKPIIYSAWVIFKAVISLFVSLVYCAESTVRWFVVREKHCWMAADSADKSKRTGQMSDVALRQTLYLTPHQQQGGKSDYIGSSR
jgi:hypothetical protein